MGALEILFIIIYFIASTPQAPLSKGTRVTWWGKPTWRPWNAKTTKAPWWKPQTTPVHQTAHWNARPTGRPSPLPQTTPSRRRSQWENSVHGKRRRGGDSRRHRKQESSAPAQAGAGGMCDLLVSFFVLFCFCCFSRVSRFGLAVSNNLPSTEQAAKTQQKQDQSFSFIFRRC